MFEGIRKKWHKNDIEWLRKHGFAQRGRAPGDKGGGKQVGGHVVKVGSKAGTVHTKLIARHLRNGVEIDRREVVNRKVTTAFVNFIVAQLQTETSIFGDFKYHDSGTGVVAESPSDVGLGTPTGVARVAGSQEEGAVTYEYKSIGTITYDASYSVTEHGLFNASTGVTLMDRTVFASIGVDNTDQIEFTFTIQFSAEA